MRLAFAERARDRGDRAPELAANRLRGARLRRRRGRRVQRRRARRLDQTTRRLGRDAGRLTAARASRSMPRAASADFSLRADDRSSRSATSEIFSPRPGRSSRYVKSARSRRRSGWASGAPPRADRRCAAVPPRASVVRGVLPAALHDDLTALATRHGVAIGQDLDGEDGAYGRHGAGRRRHAEARSRRLRSQRNDDTTAHQIEHAARRHETPGRHFRSRAETSRRSGRDHPASGRRNRRRCAPRRRARASRDRRERVSDGRASPAPGVFSLTLTADGRSCGRRAMRPSSRQRARTPKPPLRRRRGAAQATRGASTGEIARDAGRADGLQNLLQDRARRGPIRATRRRGFATRAASSAQAWHVASWAR